MNGEQVALAQLKRDCEAEWPEPGTSARALDRRSPACSRNTRNKSGQAGDPEVERRAFAFAVTAPGVLEGVLIPYGVSIRIGDGLDEVFEPGSLEVKACW